MTEPIQRLTELLLRWLLPSSGRHRAIASRIGARTRRIHGVEVAG
ncbi:hypothetical protein [Streptomyces gilvosporeus]|nr:hypothetical protein [Streptomyces gilvosporeus]